MSHGLFIATIEDGRRALVRKGMEKVGDQEVERLELVVILKPEDLKAPPCWLPKPPAEPIRDPNGAPWAKATDVRPVHLPPPPPEKKNLTLDDILNLKPTDPEPPINRQDQILKRLDDLLNG